MTATIVGGIFVNIVFAYLADKLNIPLFLDVIGTIGVAFVAGAFPALMVAVFTNLFCGLLRPWSHYRPGWRTHDQHQLSHCVRPYVCARRYD